MAQPLLWQPLEAGVPVLEGTGAGRIVALVASGSAVEAGWAGTAALDLARAWSDTGQRVVLADCALDHPTLHAAAGISNTEGVSDSALFGVSVGRVARPVDDGQFYVITAGTAVADPVTVAASRRWGALLDGFVEAGVTLLTFLRGSDHGSAAFMGGASDIVVLAAPDEPLPMAVQDLQGIVRAVTGPGDAVPAAPSLEGGAPPSGISPPPAGGGGRRGRKILTDFGDSEAQAPRPPTAWTASGPGAGRRIAALAGLAVLLIVYLLVTFGIL